MAINLVKKKAPKPSAPKKTPLRVGAALAGSKFKRIMELPEDKKAALDNMFYEGVSVAKIVSVARDGWGLFRDIKEQTLIKFLYRYKWDVIDKTVAVRADNIEDQRKAGILQAVSTDIEVLEEVAALISVQRGRVKKLLDRERDMPMLFSQLGGEMKTLAGFVQQYANLSFDLGTLRRAPTTTFVHTEGPDTVIQSDGRDEVMFSLDSTRKIEDAAKVFFDALNVVEVLGP